MTELPNEELNARLAAIAGGPWARSRNKARRGLAPIGRIPSIPDFKPIALTEVVPLAPNKNKIRQLSKTLRLHFASSAIKDEEEINFRDALDEALVTPQLYELAVQTGYLPESSVRTDARNILTGLLWSDPARKFVEGYDYVAIPMLAARVDVSGFVAMNPPEPNPGASIRFSGFLAHFRAFHLDKQIDTWTRFLDDYVDKAGEQNWLWEYLHEEEDTPPSRFKDLLAGCHLFVTSLATAFHILPEEELGQYGLLHAYWLQKFFGYKRGPKGVFIKDKELWGESDSWAKTFSESKYLVLPDSDPEIQSLVREQFAKRVGLLKRTFDAVRALVQESRRRTPGGRSLGWSPKEPAGTS